LIWVHCILNMKRLFINVYPLLWTYAVWLLIGVVSGTSATFSVVMSGSMEPEIKKGDILISVAPTNLRVGDIVLFDLPHREDKIPIVHRIIKILEGDRYLTKGDANPIDDRGLYRDSFDFLPQHAVIGKVRGHIPWIGWASLVLQPYKLIVLALVVISAVHSGLFRPATREEEERERKIDSVKDWFVFLLYPLKS